MATNGRIWRQHIKWYSDGYYITNYPPGKLCLSSEDRCIACSPSPRSWTKDDQELIVKAPQMARYIWYVEGELAIEQIPLRFSEWRKYDGQRKGSETPSSATGCS